MGNCQGGPQTGGENVKEFICRKFGKLARKKKIDELVKLAIQDDETEFKNIAGSVKLTKRELDRFYDERDTITNEFDDGILEIEMYKYGHETPSEYSEPDSDEYETDYTDSQPASPAFTPVPLKFENPMMQRMFEEYCEKKWDQELDIISLSDLPELDEYKRQPRQNQNITKHDSHVNQTKAACDSVSKSAVGMNAQNNGNMSKSKHAHKVSGTGEKTDRDGFDKGTGEFPGTCNKNGAVGLGDSETDNYYRNTKNENVAITVHDKQTCPNKKTRSRLLERVTEGLRQNRRVHSRANGTQSKFSKSESDESGLDQSEEVTSSVNANDETAHQIEDKIEDDKEGLLGRIKKRFRRMSGSRTAHRNVIHVKPASPDTTVVNCESEMEE